jgi:hypothetical protein
MKEKYPSLHWWKQQNFKVLPTIPLDLIIDGLETTFKICICDHLEGVDNISVSEKPLDNPLEYSFKEVQRRLVQITARILANAKVNTLSETKKTAMRHLSYIVGPPPKPLSLLMYNFFKYELKQLVKDQYIMWGKMVADAQEKIISREETRAKVLSELGGKVLPETRGGKITLNRDDLEALRFVYDEMKLCIMEIRQRLLLPLKKPSSEDDYSRDHLFAEDPIFLEEANRIKITEIFKNRELPLVLANESISDIAAEIIVKRLSKCRYSIKISPRTLQNILHAFTPTFAQ